MSGGESVGGSRRGVSRPGDAKSPGTKGTGVPAILRRRAQKFGPNGTRSPETLYTAHNLKPAFVLHYDWTGWPTAGTTLPPQSAAVARETSSLWEKDGLRLLEPHATAEKVQILFSVTPQVSPTFFCMRVKGRLQHALRKHGTPVDFSRKVSFRSLGENTSEVWKTISAGRSGKGTSPTRVFERPCAASRLSPTMCDWPNRRSPTAGGTGTTCISCWWRWIGSGLPPPSGSDGCGTRLWPWRRRTATGSQPWR